MAQQSLISWRAPEHVYTDKRNDWYWSVGVITLALTVVAIIFGNIISGLFVLIGASVLVMHAAKPPRILDYSINDRGVVAGNILYPFISLESFWIPHDNVLPIKIIIKSRKTFTPYIVIILEEVDPEKVRDIMLRYIAETEHQEPLMKHLLEWLGF